MNFIREKLASIGVFCVLAGIISSALQLIGYELRIFRALDQASPLMAWGVRLGFIVIGVILYVLGPKEAAHAGPPAPTMQQLAQDPRVQWLLGWAYQNLGAALAPQPGGTRVAHVAFWNAQSLPVDHDDAGVSKSILYVDGYRGGKWRVIGDLATRTTQVAPVAEDAWSYNVPNG
jgi:hypothetical protein